MTITMARLHRATAGKSSRLPLFAPLAMLAALVTPQAHADWKFSPAIDLRETYSDNLNQAESSFAQSQFITELTPRLSIANNGPRLKLTASIIEHLYAYSGNRAENTNSSQLELQGDARAKLVEDLLFLDSSASISQQSISAFGPQVTAGNGYSNANRSEVRTYRVSPYITHRFGAFATTQVRYSHDSVTSGNRGFGDSTSDVLSLSIGSGAVFRKIGWGLQYSRQEIDNSLVPKTRTENAAANLQFRLSPTLSLTANGGYDRYDYEGLGDKTAGKSYSVGLDWSPSLRSNLRASVGKRYFGTTYALTALHRSRHTVWSINYDDNVTTSRDQFLQPAAVDTAAMLDRLFSATIVDPIARQQAVEAYIRANGLPRTLADSVNYLSNRFFRQRQLQASAAFNTSKTTTIVSLNASKRDSLSTQQSDSVLLGPELLNLNDDTRQTVASITSNYRISPRTGINLSFSDSKSESVSKGVKGNYKQVGVSVSSQFQRKLRGVLEVRHNRGLADVTGGRSYRENAVSASLSLQL